VHGRDERERRDDHLVARAHVEEQRAHLERVRARRREEDALGSDGLREDLLGAAPMNSVAGDVVAGEGVLHGLELGPDERRLVERDHGLVMKERASGPFMKSRSRIVTCGSYGGWSCSYSG